MNEQWQVIYYVSPKGNNPVRSFFDAAGPKLKAKTLRVLLHVEEYGLQTIIPHTKKLAGTPLWEIRILGGENVRILFVTRIGRRIVLLHAFYKKTAKTPHREIEVSLARLRDYELQVK